MLAVPRPPANDMPLASSASTTTVAGPSVFSGSVRRVKNDDLMTGGPASAGGMVCGTISCGGMSGNVAGGSALIVTRSLLTTRTSDADETDSARIVSELEQPRAPRLATARAPARPTLKDRALGGRMRRIVTTPPARRQQLLLSSDNHFLTPRGLSLRGRKHLCMNDGRGALRTGPPCWPLAGRGSRVAGIRLHRASRPALGSRRKPAVSRRPVCRG